MKRTYISPLVEVEEYEELCQTGLTPSSYKIRTEPVAPDQQDILPDAPEIEKPSDEPPTTWDW